MTAADIVERLFSSKGVTAERIKKAQGAALRNHLEWQTVLFAMTTEQRKAVEDAEISRG